MMTNGLLDITNWAAFGASLVIGLLIGLERERSPAAKAGVRTFALVALLGTLTTVVDARLHAGWLVPLGLLLVAGMLIAAYQRDGDAADPGTTTVIAAAVTYLLGVLVGLGEVPIAGALAIGVTALLYFKPELEGFSTTLPRQDIVSVLQFLAITFIVLPIVPNEGMGPYGVLNPRHIWLMVVLIAGIGLVSYVLGRSWGHRRHGIVITGLLGGLVSSTATTVLYAKRATDSEASRRHALIVVLFANLVPIVRIALIATVVAPAVARAIAPVAAAALLCGLVATLLSMRALERGNQLPVPETRNPTELPAALSFGLLYAVVLLAGAWLSDVAGSSGLYLTAAASGLVDVDAATLSAFNLLSLERIDMHSAIVSIGLAYLANMIFKLGVLIWYGGMTLARGAILPLGSAALGGAIALFWVA